MTDDPIVLTPPVDVRAVSAQLVALVRGLLLGAVVAGLDTGVTLYNDGELNPRALAIGAAVAAGRWILEGFVLDRKAPPSATPFGGDVAQPAKAQIVAEGIKELEPLAAAQFLPAEIVSAPAGLDPAVVRAAVAAAMPRSTTDSRRRVATAIVDNLAASVEEAS